MYLIPILSLVITLLLCTGATAQQRRAGVLPQQLHAMTVEYIAHDEKARTFFGVQEPLPILVLDTVISLNLSLNDDQGLVNFLRDHRDSTLNEDVRHVRTGISHCAVHLDTTLRPLSTTIDSTATLEFFCIDSSMSAWHYLVMAYLYKDRHVWYDEEGEILVDKGILAYLLVFSRRGELQQVYSEEAQR